MLVHVQQEQYCFIDFISAYELTIDSYVKIIVWGKRLKGKERKWKTDFDIRSFVRCVNLLHDYKNVRNGNYYHYQMVSNISGRHQALCSNSSSSSSSIALIHTSKTIHKYWILLLALKKYSLRRYSVHVWVYSSLYMVVRVV